MVSFDTDVDDEEPTMGFGLDRRKGAAIAVATALAAGLAACGGDSTGTGGGASVWGLTGGTEQMLRTSFDAWNEANPERSLTAEFFANDAYKERIRTAVGAGNAPTLIWSWAGGTLREYVENGHVVDLTDVASDLLDRTIPSVAQNGMIDGRLFAVPNNNVQPVILFYNREVLDAAGVEVPATFDELLDAVPALVDAGVIPFSLAGQSVWPMLMWIQYLTDRIGGPEAFAAVVAGEEGAWQDPAFLAAATKIRELVDAGAFGDAFGSVNADQQADLALVHQGRAAFILQGAWVFPDFVKHAPELVAAGNLGFATFPEVAGGAGDALNIVGNPANFWSISAAATAEAQEVASDFIASHVLTDDQVTELLSLGSIPPVLGLEDQIRGLPNDDFLMFQYEMVTDAPHFQLSWDQALPGAQAEVLLTNLSQLFLRQITPEQFVQNMDATL